MRITTARLEEQRRLLDASAAAHEPELKRVFFAMLALLVKKTTQRMLAFAKFKVQLEERVVVAAMNTANDSLMNFVKVGLETAKKREAWAALVERVNELLLEQHEEVRDFVAPMLSRFFEVFEAHLARTEQSPGLTRRQLENEWWRVSRVFRTAQAWAFNSIRIVAARRVGDESGMLRWTELVNDATGEPMDDRVAPDSLVLHGQVIEPGGFFTMPPDDRVRQSEWLRQWQHPPNRPNDRSVLTWWFPESGVPAWRWDGSRRVRVE